MKKRAWQRVFASLMAILMVISLAPTAYGASDNIMTEAVNAGKKAQEKISSELSEQFEDNRMVTYLIKMSEQTDTATVARLAKERALAKNESVAQQKLTIRSAVVSALRETAERTQSNLTDFLEKRKKEGEVEDYKSFFIVNAMAITSTKEVMEELAHFPEVAKILPDEERFLDQAEPAPTDEMELLNQPENDPIGWNIHAVNAPAAWSMGIDGTGIVVANLDSGVDITHPTLQRKWRGYDADGNVVNPELSWYDAHSGRGGLPADTDGHGTHTMGTMVGSGPDGENQIGVAPGAKWIAVRVFNPSTTDSILLDGGQWILAPRDAAGNLHPELAPDVVNNSWSGGSGMDEWYRPMVQAWRDAQIFPGFSAGNTRAGNPGGPGSVANPANYPESFATGAVDINNRLASFSLQGPSPYGELKPEVVAPGVAVRSAIPSGGYANYNGTSMSGPHSAAAAALLLHANASLTVDDLEEILINTATPLTDSAFPESPNNGYGHGIINVGDAVSSVANGLGAIQGRVLIEGDDLEAPTLEHTPITFAFSGMDIPLVAQVADQVAVIEVEAFARNKKERHWTYIPLKRTSGDHREGIYEGAIPYHLLDEDGVEYYLRVNDYGNNGFKTEIYTIEISNGITPGYSQDFEEDAFGFTSGGTNNSWEWGVPTSGPGNAYNGTKVMATNLSGNYPNNSNAYLLMPPIDLTGEERAAFLSFYHWFNLENNYDKGAIYIASADSEYQFVKLKEFTGASNEWEREFVDLTPYIGQQIFFMFNFTSDGSINRDGWYIDQINLIGSDDEAPAAPTNLEAKPSPTGGVLLNWTASPDWDVKEYRVYRADEEGGEYTALGTTPEIRYDDTSIAEEGTYYYVVTAIDYSQNESAYSEEVFITVTPPITIFFDDFEGEDDNGWTHSGTNDVWERGIPTSGPGSAYTGNHVWATNLAGNYQYHSNFALYSPVIDLTNYDNAALLFYHWYEIEGTATRAWDQGLVEVKRVQEETWHEVALYSSSTDGKEWREAAHSLDDFVGDEVQIRFRLTSDGSVNKAGWYIDHVKLISFTDGNPTSKIKRFEPIDTPMDKGKEQEFTLEFKLPRTESKQQKAAEESGGISLDSLPAYATVTIVESGRSVKTDPSNGRFSMIHPAGEFTLRAEAYGYYPQSQGIAIPDHDVITANFFLQPIPKGNLTGTVVDERTKEPIAGARLTLMEDANIPSVTTDEHGRFQLEALAGEYTLAISASEYRSKRITVEVLGHESVELELELKPFVGYPGELAYDDGTAENARAFYDAGNGWAIRMSPEAGQQVQVTGANLLFWDSSWPTPGGDRFQVAIYDASKGEQEPGQLLAGPFEMSAKRDGTWTHVDLEEYGIMVTGDFYIVYIQTDNNPYAPGLATDEDGPFYERGYKLVGGVWSKTPRDEGNYMIRATVKYEVDAPVITTPIDGSYTNQDTITVEGSSPADGATIQLFNHDEIVGTTLVEDGTFSLEVPLHDGENRLAAEAIVNGKVTDRSAPNLIILDRLAPQLDVSSPQDHARVNQESLHIIGTVVEAHLDALLINGESAAVDENGAFDHRIFVDAGENLITVKAIDKAGNETEVSRTVYADFTLPEFNQLQPAEDQYLEAGDTLEVSFQSEEGLDAYFIVELDLHPMDERGVAMHEVEPGYYVGSWTIPANLQLAGALIVVHAKDEAGNTASAIAEGRLYIAEYSDPGQPEEPVDPVEPGNPPLPVITAPANTKINRTTFFDASNTRMGDAKIEEYRWDFGDGSQTVNGIQVRHRYTTPGTYTVTLTVSDEAQNMATTTHTIVVE